MKDWKDEFLKKFVYSEVLKNIPQGIKDTKIILL